MAGVRKNLMIRAGADFSAIMQQSQKAAQSMKQMQTSVSGSCSKMQSAVNGLKKAFGALGIGLLVRELVQFSKEAAAAYDEVVQGEVQLATVMRNTMGASNAEIQSILDLADAQQALGIVEGDAVVAGAQELATYLNLTSSLETLIPVMNDMAAQQYGYNVTAEQTTTIATMLGKVMEGQVSGLSRYGYYFTEAQEAVLKYGTEAERAAMLAEVVEQSVGGMNQALAATPTGRMKQLANVMGDIKESFGQAVRTLGTVFLPVLNTVAKVLAAVATLANKVAQAIANVFGGKVAGKEWQYTPATAAISDAADATEDLTEKTNESAKAAQDAKKAFQQASFDTLHILQDASKNASSGSSSAGNDTTDGSDLIKEVATGIEESENEGLTKFEEFLQKLKDLWEDFTGSLDFTKLKESWARLKEALAPLADDIGKGLKWLYDNVLKPLASWTISELAPRLVNLLASAFDFLHGVIVALQPLLEAIWPILKWFAEFEAFAITYALDALADTLHQLGDWMAGNLSPLEEFVMMLRVLTAITFGYLIGEMMAFKMALDTVAGSVINLGAAVGFGGAATAAGSLSTALAVVSGSVGAFEMDLATGFVPALGAAAASAETAGTAITAGIAGPIAAVIALIAGIGLVVYEAIKHWDELKASLVETGEQIKATFRQAKEDIEGDLENIRQFGENVWTGVLNAAHAAGEGIRTAFESCCTAVKEAFGQAKEDLMGDMETLREFGSGVWEGIKTTAQAAGDAIKTTFENACQDVQRAIRWVVDTWGEMQVAAADTADVIKKAWEGMGVWFRENVSEPIVAWGTEAWESIKDMATKAADKVKETWEDVKATLNRAWESVRDTAGQAWERIRQGGEQAWKNVSSAWARAKTFFTESVFNPLIGAVESGVNRVIAVFDGMLTSVQRAIGKLKEIIKGVKDTAASWGSAISWKNLSISGLMQKIQNIRIPFLAEGAVIPPNNKFAAVLGDQTSGVNIETPERLLRTIVREESANGALTAILEDILAAVRDGKEITVDGVKLGRTVQRSMALEARARG